MKKKTHEFASKGFNLPPDRLEDYDFKVHINGKTHALVLKDDLEKLNTKYHFLLGIVSTFDGFISKTITEINKWVEDSVK